MQNRSLFQDGLFAKEAAETQVIIMQLMLAFIIMAVNFENHSAVIFIFYKSLF